MTFEEQYHEIALSCFRYLGFTSLEQVDRLTIPEYHLMMEAAQLRVLSFLKLTFLEGISWKITRRLFHVDARSACEKKVIRLARQTPLSCAEIIKCIEMDIRRLKDGYDVLDKLYDDNDLNCDNFAQAVREYRCSHEVITAVANLYLRQQIMIDTY